MKLFKNKVGRPSNKTLRKRKIFLSLVIVFILLFGFGVFFILNNRNVISQNKGIVVNSKPVLKITQITKGSSVKKGATVKYSIKLKNLSEKPYYYKLTVNYGNDIGTSSCEEFSNINKTITYPIKVNSDNTYIKYTIYTDSECKNVYKTSKTKTINLKKETTTVGKTKTFTAVFKNNGATKIGSQKLSCTTNTGSCSVTAPTITRDGYNIDGWSKSKYLPSRYKVGEKITLTKNQTFYAKTTYKLLKTIINAEITSDNNNSKVDYNTVINFDIKFANNTEDKYYYKWRTYTEGDQTYESTCLELKDGFVSHPTLTINNNNRYGKVTIYKDASCSTEYKSVNTSTYSAIEYIPNNSINETNSYHYSILSDKLKLIYKYLYDKKDNMINKSNIYFGILNNTLGNIDSKEVSRAFECLRRDHPEFYYISTYKRKALYWGSTKISFVGDLSSTDLRNELKKIDNIVNNVVNNAKKKSSDYEKLLSVHDYIIKNMEYKLNTAYSIDGYTVKTGQCMTYALMYQYALNKLGIRSVYVNGYTMPNNEGSHAWNYVYLNNKWYLVDVTWDDSSTSTKYFLLGSNSSLLKNRTTVSNYTFPTLSKTNYK